MKTPSPNGSDRNRSSRLLIIAIGCLIVVGLAAAMLMRSGSTRTTIPSAGPGAHSEQH